MKAKLIGIPIAIFAAVAIVWLLMRGQSNAATVTQQPSASSAGVPSYATPAVQTYQVNPPVLQPSPIVSLAAPAAPYSSAAQGATPSYLSYNLAPTHALNKGKPSGAAALASAPAGCGGSCGSCTPSCKDNNAQFSDGQGNGCMSVSKKKQIDALDKKYPGLWANMQDNIQSAGFSPDDVMMIFLHQSNPNFVLQGTAKPSAPGGQEASTAGGSRVWPGGMVTTGKIGHG